MPPDQVTVAVTVTEAWPESTAVGEIAITAVGGGFSVNSTVEEDAVAGVVALSVPLAQ
jgi:hypothetical protein